jgi:hypothetical protein
MHRFFLGSDGVRHAVEVGAETLHEATGFALKSFQEHDCAPGPRGASLCRGEESERHTHGHGPRGH